MSQIVFDFIQEEDQRNNVLKVDVHEIKHPRLPEKYGLRFPQTFTKGRFILHSTGGSNIYLQKYGRNFPYLLDTHKGKVVSLTFIGDGTEYLCWNVRAGVDKPTIKMRCHTLCGAAFLINKNPKVLRIVDHVDQDKKNFQLNNLRWLSDSDSVKNVDRNRYKQMRLDLIEEGKE
tara:strand:+ start:768 stop:1289 length:522 start_codon:yes stop_codon:yes gene_type:complete